MRLGSNLLKLQIMVIDDILDHGKPSDPSQTKFEIEDFRCLLDIDCLVIRTKNRALPRGSISLERAWMFFAIQVAIGIYLAQALLDTVS